MADEPLVLGIETSCDETGIGVVRGREVLANVIASSMDEQARYGGVVPEIAARAHLEALGPSKSPNSMLDSGPVLGAASSSPAVFALTINKSVAGSDPNER